MFPNFSLIFHIVQKFSFVLGSLIYLVFAFIVLKQTTMMSKNVHDKFNPILITIATIHLIASIVLVFLTLTIL